MEKRKTSFQVSLILLVLMLLQISKQSLLICYELFMGPIQEPLISEGTNIQILLDPSISIILCSSTIKGFILHIA
jgi:hypothetical protein